MTPQETIEAGRLMIAYGESVLAGKPLRIESDRTGRFRPDDEPDWDWPYTNFRLAPEPKRVELKAKDVPLGALIDIPNKTGLWVVVGVYEDKLQLARPFSLSTMSFEDLLLNNATIDLRDGNGFRPAWKEEV